MRVASLLAALALACGPASAQSAMNYAYQVTGDPQARPIQAFDDGQKLYVQFRDVESPPAPIGATGPLAYTIRGPYLVLPIVPSVQLRYGPFTAWVRAEGVADSSPGVVSVTRPVEVSVAELAPVAPLTSTVVPLQVNAPAARTVSGEIAASGPGGVQRTVDAPAERAAQEAMAYEDASKASAFAGLRGKHVEIKADGSAAGARAAQAALRACRTVAARCAVAYSGSPNNKITIVESN